MSRHTPHVSRRPALVARFAVAAALLGALLAIPAAARPRPGIALAPGDEAPLLRGRDLESGESTAVDWSVNRLTLVNFWATWCVPCQQEMPELNALWLARKGEGLAVIGVNHQEVPAVEVQSFVHTFGASYPILLAKKTLGAEWGGIGALPTSFLIDPRGKILRRYVGATPEQIEGLAADVAAVLAGESMAPLVVPDASNAVTSADIPPPSADEQP